MYIKNRRNIGKTKPFASYQTSCLTESFVLRNRLLFIYQALTVTIVNHQYKTNE
jgi:hypothetical protein